MGSRDLKNGNMLLAELDTSPADDIAQPQQAQQADKLPSPKVVSTTPASTASIDNSTSQPQHVDQSQSATETPKSPKSPKSTVSQMTIDSNLSDLDRLQSPIPLAFSESDGTPVSLEPPEPSPGSSQLMRSPLHIHPPKSLQFSTTTNGSNDDFEKLLNGDVEDSVDMPDDKFDGPLHPVSIIDLPEAWHEPLSNITAKMDDRHANDWGELKLQTGLGFSCPRGVTPAFNCLVADLQQKIPLTGKSQRTLPGDQGEVHMWTETTDFGRSLFLPLEPSLQSWCISVEGDEWQLSFRQAILFPSDAERFIRLCRDMEVKFLWFKFGVEDAAFLATVQCLRSGANDSPKFNSSARDSPDSKGRASNSKPGHNRAAHAMPLGRYTRELRRLVQPEHPLNVKVEKSAQMNVISQPIPPKLLQKLCVACTKLPVKSFSHSWDSLRMKSVNLLYVSNIVDTVKEVLRFLQKHDIFADVPCTGAAICRCMSGTTVCEWTETTKDGYSALVPLKPAHGSWQITANGRANRVKAGDAIWFSSSADRSIKPWPSDSSYFLWCRFGPEDPQFPGTIEALVC